MNDLLPRDSIQMQCVLQAFQDAADAKADHDRARDAYDGYSWGYWGRNYIDRMESAALQAEDLLSQMIDQKVTESLKRRLP